MVTTLTEIDDVYPGLTVYLPCKSGFLWRPEGRTTIYKPYRVDRYYKRGYEDRVTVVSESGGESQIRYCNIRGYWRDGMDRVSATPADPSWESRFSSGWV